MQKIIKILMCFTISLLLLGSCEESKRFEISRNDNTPPGKPTFVSSKPLLGGARVFFIPPDDEDLFSIEASYLNTSGKTVRFAVSYFTDSLDVMGFGSAGDHVIELYATDLSGNRSAGVNVTVESLEPAVVTVAKSLQVLSSFASMMFKWTNETLESLYVWVDISYLQNGKRYDNRMVFNTNQTEMRFIDSLKISADEPVTVMVNVRDKFGNTASAKDTTIMLLTDNIIAKNGWSLPVAGTVMGGIAQVNGLFMNEVIDGVLDIDVENYFITYQNNPWNLIIDLGEEYELSRIVTHQRHSGYNTTFGEVDVRGNLYRGDNVLSSNLYGWNETGQAWQLLSRRTIVPPLVKTDNEYMILGKTGDMAFIFPQEPQFSAPTRFIRFEAVNGKYISEITLYGRKSK